MTPIELNLVELNPELYRPEIVTDKEDEKNFKKIIRKYKLKKYVCIAPLAERKRQWDLKNFDEIIDFLNKVYPEYNILLFCSDKRKEVKKVNWLSKRNYCFPIINENLRTVYLLLKNSDLVITLNSGLMHLAWAGNSKLIAIVEESRLNYIRPLGRNSKVLIAKNDVANSVTIGDMKKEIKKTLK